MRLRWVELPVQGAAVVPREAVVDVVAALVPGQWVHVVVSPGKRRRTMHGVLAGRIRDLDPAEPAAVRREAWGDLADPG